MRAHLVFAGYVSSLALTACQTPTEGIDAPPAAWTRVVAGGAHTCGLGTDGALFCWGSNRHAQLGAEISGSATAVPRRVVGSRPFTDVSVGWQHTCAVAEGGTAYCWGHDDSGQLGIGKDRDEECVSGAVPFRCRTKPQEVAGDLTFASVAAGMWHSCGLTSGGVAYCWGLNRSGQLGTKVSGETCLGFTCSTTPVAVAGDLRFSVITAGFLHACALTGDGAAYCWGDNGFGALRATAPDTCSPGGVQRPCSFEPVRVSSELTFALISAGNQHTCAVASDGASYCWGLSVSGKVGTDTEAEACALGPCVPRPTAVAGSLGAAGEIACGNLHSCAIGPDALAYCWGAGQQGQLGTGAIEENRTTPTRVSGDLEFAAVSAGGFHTCAVTPDGAAYCWGDNASGQLASSTSGQVAGPVRIPGG
jgi:alpha-tubulin suppressor-like RCC1 family protein